MGKMDVYGGKSMFLLQKSQEHKYLEVIRLSFKSPFMNQWTNVMAILPIYLPE